MGSGSSKAGSKSPRKTRDTNAQIPVANVNKHAATVSNREERNTGKETNEPSAHNADVETTQHISSNDYHFRVPIKPIDTNKKDKEKEKHNDKKEKEKQNSWRGDKHSSKSRSNVSGLVFQDDSDIENDIDEVLRIPVAVDDSRHSRDKEKKSKKKKNKEQDSNQNDFIDNDSSFTRNTSRDRGDEPLPETYAQRLQRKQYKLQQSMLIREKTIVRKAQDWQREDEDDMEIDPPSTGFDASKFRAVNKGGENKKELFSAVTDDLQTPRYLQSTGQHLDEVDVQNRDVSPNRQLPNYNQSELDLMRELEQDIL